MLTYSCSGSGDDVIGSEDVGDILVLIYSCSIFGDVDDLGDVVGFGDVVGDCVFIYPGSIVLGDFGEGGGFDTLDLDDIGGSFVCENKFTTSA